MLTAHARLDTATAWRARRASPITTPSGEGPGFKAGMTRCDIFVEIGRPLWCGRHRPPFSMEAAMSGPATAPGGARRP
jgi:hypothetical protein